MIDSNGAPSTIALTSSASPTTVGSNVTIACNVSDAADTGKVPTGTVTFYNGNPTSGGTEIGSPVNLTSDAGAAAAALTTEPMDAGLQALYGVYSGDEVYAANTATVDAVVYSTSAASAT